VGKEIVVVGLGEIGKPLFDLIRTKYSATGVDMQPVHVEKECDILHICFPFDFGSFPSECERYIRMYKPALTIINSTVAPVTARRISEDTHCPVVSSPVRGKHLRMRQELLTYTKFIGGTDAEACRKAEAHFRSLGMKTKVLSSPEATEIAKLSETTYFGLLIAWAQEIERYCDLYDLDYDEVVSFYDEIAYLPRVRYTPGIIGGHCVMPNIEILQTVLASDVLDTIKKSNESKVERESLRERRGSELSPSASAG
jgi:UDP-N-acetyl-D-mannosaminuronate dehydrogenase